MAKRTIDQNVESGILSAQNIADLLNASKPAVYKWMDNEELPSFTLGLSKERRATAPDVVKFCEKYKIPIHPKLLLAKEMYESIYYEDGSDKKEKKKKEVNR